MIQAINIILVLIVLTDFSIAENNVKIKDVLRSPSKFNNKNNTDENAQKENGDVFRNEMTLNLKRCVSDGSDNNEDKYVEKNKDKNKNKDNNQYKREDQSNYSYGGYSDKGGHNNNNNNRGSNTNNNDSNRHSNRGHIQDNNRNNNDCENDQSNTNYNDRNFPNRNKNEYNSGNFNKRNSDCEQENNRNDNKGSNYGQMNPYGANRDNLPRQGNDNQGTDYKYYNNDNYYNSGNNRGYGQRMKRGSNSRDYENQCVSQCVFGYMEVLDDDDVPSETMVIKWVQDHITNDDLIRIQTLREIRKCFARLSTTDIDDGCQFSKELTKCLNVDM